MECYINKTVMHSPNERVQARSYDYDKRKTNTANKYNSYTGGASTKWMALLNIMANACEDSQAGAHLKLDTAMKYVQTYGHCSEQGIQLG